MPDEPLPERVARALADVLAESLAQGTSVDVPGLGLFWRRHEPGRVGERSGQPVMHPPADGVAFTPSR